MRVNTIDQGEIIQNIPDDGQKHLRLTTDDIPMCSRPI